MSETTPEAPPPIDRAPSWCGYPPQPDGSVWCYSLLLGYVTGRSYCVECECDALKEQP